jgi:molybdenum cofactor cytidylyltransferase
MNYENCVIILAAGHSKRMGVCKFLLPMSNGISLIENIYQTYVDFEINQIILVTQGKYVDKLKEIFNKYDIETKYVINENPDYERFYSLQIGLKVASFNDYCFIQNADEPFIDKFTLQLIYENREKGDFVSPIYKNKGGHPILINKKTINELLACNLTSNLKNELLGKNRYNILVKNDLTAIDIDTPEDYRKQITNMITY